MRVPWSAPGDTCWSCGEESTFEHDLALDSLELRRVLIAHAEALGRRLRADPTIASGTPPLLCLPHRLAGGALGILVLALCAALLGEVARLHERSANFAGRQSHAGGMPRPGQIGAMEIAAVARVAMELG